MGSAEFQTKSENSPCRWTGTRSTDESALAATLSDRRTVDCMKLEHGCRIHRCTYAHVSICVCIYVYIYIHVQICMYICVCIYIHTRSSVCMNVYMHMYIYIYTYVYVYIYICIHICMYICWM